HALLSHVRADPRLERRREPAGAGRGSGQQGLRHPRPADARGKDSSGEVSAMAASGGTRPNFLFIIADQLRWDHLGCYGNKIVKTPAIDKLAAGGFTADAFHVASPICMPNRATLMTGRMPSVHGVRHNGIPLSLDATTFADLLRQAGYRTAMVGKSHLQNMTGDPPKIPPGRYDPTAREGDARTAAVRERGGRYDQELVTKWRDDPQHDVTLPYYGFETAELANDHGDQVEG